jgi:outer membrane protein
MTMKTTLLLFALLLSIGAQAQQNAFSLEQAVNYAFENNLTLKNAQLKVADARELIIERRAVGLPQLRGTANYQYFIDIPTTVVPDFSNPSSGVLIPLQFGTKHSANAGLNLTINAIDASYLIGLKAAKLYKEFAAQEFTIQRQDTRHQVINAYLPALLLDENLRMLDKNIANLQALLNETRALFREGFVEQLDVDRLELSLLNLQSERDNLSRQRELALNALKFTLGYPMDQPLELSEQLAAISTAVSETDLGQPVSYASRPEYALANMGEELNVLNVKLFTSNYIPTISLFGSYQQSLFANDLSEGQWFPATLVGAQLNVPIFDGLATKARRQRAKLELETARNQIRELERVIDLDLQNARANYLNAQQRLANQERSLQLAEKIFQTAQVKYREGVGSSLEISQAEQSLYQSQQLRIQALYDLALAKAAVDKALGR